MSNTELSGDHGDTTIIQPGYLGTTPPKGQLPPRGQRSWIDRPEQLLQAIIQLQSAPVVAIDAEFTQIRSHSQGDTGGSGPRLALLQLAITGQCFVVDALRLHDLTPLNAVIADPDHLVLLHGAGADLRVMAERNLTVAHYYDLEATSRSIFGQHESSLASMLQRAFNARLDKSLQRTDWTRRPLPPAMVAYAARDAEMTLELYSWLKQHFEWALHLHESTNLQGPIPEWIDLLLRGAQPLPADMVVAEAIGQGVIRDQEQIYRDCREALTTLTHPMRRSRLLRLFTDLSLTGLIPDIQLLLEARTADERAAAVRALNRLSGKDAQELISPLLNDPVYEVRKAAQNALRTSTGHKESRSQSATPERLADGTRSWTVGEATNPDHATDTNEEDDWRARLRSFISD